MTPIKQCTEELGIHLKHHAVAGFIVADLVKRIIDLEYTGLEQACCVTTTADSTLASGTFSIMAPILCKAANSSISFTRLRPPVAEPTTFKSMSGSSGSIYKSRHPLSP